MNVSDAQFRELLDAIHPRSKIDIKTVIIPPPETREVKFGKHIFRITSLTVAQVEDFILCQEGKVGIGTDRKVVQAAMENACGPLSPQAEEAIRSLEWKDYRRLVHVVIEVTGLTVLQK